MGAAFYREALTRGRLKGELRRYARIVGIHGTNRPELVPGRVSHGCIRMRNEDILQLGRLMPIRTPVTIT